MAFEDDVEKPPEYTCPSIDNAKSHARRTAWRLRGLKSKDEEILKAIERLKELQEALEVVRQDNIQMRKAYRAMRAKLRSLEQVDETEAHRHPDQAVPGSG